MKTRRRGATEQQQQVRLLTLLCELRVHGFPKGFHNQTLAWRAQGMGLLTAQSRVYATSRGGTIVEYRNYYLLTEAGEKVIKEAEEKRQKEKGMKDGRQKKV